MTNRANKEPQYELDTEDAMLSTAIEREGHCYSRLRQSDDFREGVEAFHAKRPAKFKGT